MLPDAYFTGFEAMYRAKRDLICAAVAKAGLVPLTPEGTYFVIANTDAKLGAHPDDVSFCRWLTTTGGVAAIPPSAFCFSMTESP